MSRSLIIDVHNVSMRFRMPTKKVDNLKEFFLTKIRRTVEYKEFYSLRSVNLKVEEGDKVAIIGHNGAGKSTLLKLIAGVMKPTDGKILVNGSVAPLLELGAGFDPELSGYENIYLNAAILGKSKKYIDERIEKIIEFADLGEFIHMAVKNYSSGMRARLGFAIATEVDPDILLIDELLSVGDQTFRQKSLNRIESMMNQGKTVVLVTHDLTQVTTYSNRVIWLDKGEVKDTGSPEEIVPIYQEYMKNKGGENHGFQN